MQTIIVKLDIKKLTNIDLGVSDKIVERAEKVSGGAIVDGDYGYFSPDGSAAVWLNAENAAEGAKLLIKLFESEKFCENDLTAAAEMYISEEEHALLFDCTRVYPTE
ncbi:MAG: hypothetical protein IJD85_03465 [Oscillospiraceae bacterium]|nr:hypothetical protein [Oscillospiraceae bacterium]